MPTQLLLPQNDSQRKEQREQHLEKMRELYTYQLTYKGNIATLKKLPEQEKPNRTYKMGLLTNASKLIFSLPNLILTLLKGYPYKTFKDYFFFNLSPYPEREFLENFQNDVYFGLQRIAGINPVVIQGLTKENPLPKNFQAQDTVSNLTQQSYEQTLEDGRLYLTDYSMLQKVADSSVVEEGYRKYVTAPIALYYRQDNGLLQPLAIQLYGTKPTDIDSNPIYTPNDGSDWLMAKTYLQAADGTHHELWTHATRIHYVMESIIMCTYRNLDRHHPLFPLLYPHLEHTLNVNFKPLFQPSPDGSIPTFGKMFACDNDTLVEFMGRGMRTFNFKEMAFPDDIKNRNMEDSQLYYPYRDDGKLVWKAVNKFVREYINLYYKSDQDVIEDFELQAWAKEIGGNRNENNCEITGFPTQFNTIDEVIETIGNIIFLVTGHHSCVHFGQYKYAGYIPNMPFSVYAPPTKNFPEKDVMKLFPPFGKLSLSIGMAFYQTFIFYLTNFKINQMGDYKLEMFDGRPDNIIKKYQEDLQMISQEIAKRNQSRIFPYYLMDPQQIPNGVTI